MSRLLGLGWRFPEFSLQACVSAEPGSEFRIVDSHELAGSWTAIFFWPLDFTFVCPTELVECDAGRNGNVRAEYGAPESI